MASRTDTARLLVRLFERDLWDIHGVADYLNISRSSVNTLISLPEKRFPEPIFESRDKNRHPLRLWWREDVEKWAESRPSSRSSESSTAKSKKKKGEVSS